MRHRLLFFFFNDTATTEIYTLSLHDALPISASTRFRCASRRPKTCWPAATCPRRRSRRRRRRRRARSRSEEHTSELQSRQYLVCRLLLEKKKKTYHTEWILKIRTDHVQSRLM